MASPSEWIVLAHILRPQGRRGEVLAELFTDFPDRFSEHAEVWLAVPGVGSESQHQTATFVPAEVAAHWLPVGRNAGRIVLHLAGIDTIEKAEKLTGKDVMIPAGERVLLESGSEYISDLIGCEVYDHDRLLGVVDDVQFPTSPDGTRRLEEAPPLLVVISADSEEILIPFAKALLVDLNVAAKSIRMKLPEGLADINRSDDRGAGRE